MPAKKAARKRTGKATAIRKVLVISDTHCGSSVALMPPGFVTDNGNEIKPNAIQEWLWQCWVHMIEEWVPEQTGTDPWALVINGDLVEGIHHHTTEIISSDFGDHLEIARLCYDLFNQIPNPPAKIFITIGTEVHTRNCETRIGRAIGAQKDISTGRYAFQRLDLRVNGTHCAFRHHIGTTARPYLEASQLSIHLGVEQLSAAKNDLPIPKVLGCAHRHKHGMFRDSSGMCFVTGPWQFLTRFGYKVVPAELCKPSAVMLIFEDEGKLPIDAEIIYEPKEIARNIIVI